MRHWRAHGALPPIMLEVPNKEPHAMSRVACSQQTRVSMQHSKGCRGGQGACVILLDGTSASLPLAGPSQSSI